ncbi:hypothetical protein B9Z55_028207 [Caenorhabditis nigoni]|uniref:Uncharacterized protein n=1 Tax=Caenorhabditis nigoni TaxID=1611254 RepID=A0A2G5SCB7_9PELO|nr:hypothetical protein B9Z55_028207 [Caenorhabditis nigoni]
MDQRSKSFKTVYSGSDENRVQTPDRHHHDSDNMSSSLRERRSTRFGKLSTSNDTSNTSNVKAVANTLKEPNTELSTKDRQALKRLIIALGNKYAETIVLHEKASMEVEKLEHQKKKAKEQNPTVESFAKNEFAWKKHSKSILF